MSENLLRLIPEQPIFIPEIESQLTAKEFLKSLVAEDCQVQIEVFNEIKFIDAGTNFENIFCPVCGKEIPGEWWSAAMDEAYKSQSRQLEVEVPCCKNKSTLHHLKYNFPQGFARFVLTARNPNIPDFDSRSVGQLEQILGCKLRLIWAHY